MARKPISVLKSNHLVVCNFVVYGKAAPAGSKVAGMSNQGRMFVRDSSKGSYEWKSKVSDKAAEVFGNSHELVTGPLEVWFTFHVPRPAGHYNAKGELNKEGLRNPYPAKKPDVLKLARAVEDGMTGSVWLDDAQIVSEHILKLYGTPARVEIEVRRRV